MENTASVEANPVRASLHPRAQMTDEELERLREMLVTAAAKQQPKSRASAILERLIQRFKSRVPTEARSKPVQNDRNEKDAA